MPTPINYSNLRSVPVPMNILVQNNLSPSQWVAMYLMHFELYAELAAYLEADTAPQGFNEDELEDLHKRGYILYRPVPGNHAKTSSRNMKISSLFTDLLRLVAPVRNP